MVLSLMKRIWRGWKGLVHRINGAISVVLMSIVYGLTMAPIALGFRIFRPDPTDRGLGDPNSKSFWLAVRMGRQDIQRAQRPW
jgi:hypothetical protein